MTWHRWIVLVLVVVLLLPAAALAVLALRFDPNEHKPRIIAAVEQATGRRLTLAGPIGVKLSLVPTLTLEDVSLSNPPGASRPELATVPRVEVRLAVLPLLSRRVEVRRLLLLAPDMLLEVDAGGRPNWVFSTATRPAEATPPADATPPAGEPPAAAAREAGRRPGIVVDRVAVTEGRLTYLGHSRRLRALAIEGFEAVADGPGNGAAGLLRIDGAFRLDDLPFTLRGETGSLARLLAPEGAPDAAPWPLRLAVESEGARATVEGVVGAPLRQRGIDLAVTARVADVARYAALLPDVPLPPLRDVEVAFTLRDGPGGHGPAARPVVSGLRLAVGASDLNAVLPGLRLARLVAGLPSEDGTLTLEVAAATGEVPLRLAGSLGSPLRLLPGSARGPDLPPFPVDLSFGAGSASGSLAGTIRDPVDGGIGAELVLALRVPDLAALAPLVGQPLPAVRDIAVDTRIAERGRGFAAGAILTGLAVTSSAGDLTGDVTWVVGQRQGFAGKLASRRLDLDALRPPPAPGPVALGPMSPGPMSPGPTGPVPEAAPRPAGDGRVIPDLPLPLEAIRLTDSDLRWTAAEVVAGGTVLRDVEAAVTVLDGRARVDPLAATLPGGRITLRAAADLTVTPPTVQVAVNGNGLDLGALMAMAGRPDHVQGRLDVDIDLRGQGRDLRAAAAGAHGSWKLDMVDGRLGPGLLPAQLARGLPLPADGLAISTARLHFVVADGIGRSQVMLVETSLGRVTGEGTISLRDETLAMRLDTDLRLPIPGLPQGLRLRAPVPLTGTLGAPRLDVSRAEAATAGTAASEAIERYLPREYQGPVQDLLRGLGRGR